MRQARCCRTAAATLSMVFTFSANPHCCGFQSPTVSSPPQHGVACSISSQRAATRRAAVHVLGGQVEPQQQHGGLVSRRGWWFRSKVERGKVEGLVLFGRRDAEDSGKFAEGFEQTAPFTEVMRSQNPRRYIGEDAGMGDETGVGGPRGDGRGRPWTLNLCSKRLSLLNRKLRQVKDLMVKQARDPDSLDPAQVQKIGRKMDLELEIAELEALRRDLVANEDAGGKGGGRYDPATGERTVQKAERGSKTKLPPGPFADSQREGPAGSEWKTRPQQQQRHQYAESQGEQPEAAPRPVEDVEPEPMYTRDGLKLALPRRPSKLPDPRAVPPLSTAAEGQPRDGDDNREDGDADDDVDDDDISAEIVPGGGYPKKLGAAMSYCRVSTKTTCEILIALGRVTVNGILAEDPNMRVDILKDMIVCDGVGMTLPPKIDNSDDTKRPRNDSGKRTGPIPKSEKNTWKSKVKYHWGTDDGLLAMRTRRAASAKAARKRIR